MSSWLLSLTLVIYFNDKFVVLYQVIFKNLLPLFHLRLTFKGFVNPDMENVVPKRSHIHFHCLLSAVAFHLIGEMF
jgi:hypothetical protein